MKAKSAKRKKKKVGGSKKGKGVFITLVSVILLAGSFFAYQIHTYLLPNFGTQGNPAYLYITKETSFEEVLRQLETGGYIKNVHSFERWAKMKKYPSHIKTGRYEIVDGMSNKEMIHQLSRKIQSPVKLKLNNIRTKEQLCQKLSLQLMRDSADFMEVLTNPDVLLEYNVTREEIISFFIPDTYEVYWDIKPEDFLRRMNAEYRRFWNKERMEKAEAMGLKPIQVVTLASIVEEETNLKKDKPVIAGLYLNRLRIGMPLQACPTAKFAVGDFSLKRILFEHTQFDSPYNTYVHKGLPPGPIRIPSAESIDAVLDYEKNSYLYMCAKETLNGEHYFASTLLEHNRNATKYQRAFKKKNK